MEKIIQFYGTENLTITSQLTKALQRYCNFCNDIDGGWKIIGTNICDNDPENDESSLVNIRQTPIISIPLFLRKPDNNQSDDLFHSFDKLGIFNDTPRSIGINKFLQSANFIFEKIKTVKSIGQEIKNETGYSIEVFNIQSGDLKFWESRLNDILGTKDNDKTFYIFYWQPKEIDSMADAIDNTFLTKKRNEYEIKDKIWGYSKFLRDFLKIRNRCHTVEVNEFQHLDALAIKELIIEKTSKSESIDDLKEFFLKNIKNLLESFPFTKTLPNSFEVKDIARLHLFNRSNHFQDNYFEKKFQDLVLRGIGSSHGLLKHKDTIILDDDHVNHLGMLENKLFFYDLFKNVTDACVYYKADNGNSDNYPEFLFLDDVPQKKIKSEEYSSYYNKIKSFKDWFPKSRFFYSQDKELFHKHKLFSGKDEDFDMGEFVFEKDCSPDGRIKEGSFNITKDRGPLFIGIDIDWSGEQYGFELLKQFRKNNHRIKRKCFVFVFSRFEYPSTIRKAVASGALFYFTKQNFMTLVPKVCSVLRYLEKENPLNPNYSKYENWHLMKKLEPSKIVELQTSIIKGFDYWKDKKEILEYTADYKWIQKLPKADLHCHIGSCLGPELLPITALMVLAEKFEKGKINPDSLENIIRFLRIFVNGLSVKNNEVRFIIPDLFEEFGLGTNDEGQETCLFKALEQKHGLNLKVIFPEELLLSPDNHKFDRLIIPNEFKHEYFALKQKLRDEKISYDDLMLFFILLIFLREQNLDRNSENLAKELKDIISGEISMIIKSDNNGEGINKQLSDFIRKIDQAYDIPDVEGFINGISDVFLNFKKGRKILKTTKNKGFQKKLQSASGKANSLFSYLRGCEYGGAPHLQTRLSIYLSTFYIVHHYAIPDNIRYLALRCAVNGYSKSGILNQHEAMQALLRGFNYSMKFALKQDNNVHVNLILTAKRHKAEKEFGENVALALQYRNGISIGKNPNEKCLHSFFGTDSKVVSFDLAGLEKGNRPSKFVQHFMPLLKQCFPITIHAGEEDDHEAIWEAIYLVHSQRIGHGLTLRNNRDLLQTVKERHIAIELCPISNLLTREPNISKSINDPTFCADSGCENEAIDECTNQECLEKKFAQSDYYPLRQYLNENLDVTINTDNPFISDSNLTIEYLVSAWLAGGLTKWEVLRLIKNSFRSTSIPKEQKRLLMNEIDDEIYNLLMNEGDL